ncbi:MAG: capsid cement protein [Anaerolineae bacterium]
MCALSADKLVERYDGQVIALTCKAGTTIYKGGLVAIDATGYAVPAGDVAAHVFMGVALEGATALQSVRLYRNGVFNFVAAGMAVTDMGARVYVSDDATVTTTVGNGVFVGRIVKVDSATSVWVDIGPSAPALGTVYDRSILTIPFKFAKLANGDIVTTFTPGFAGVIVKWGLIVTDPVTTAEKVATLNLEINTTNVTGGVLSPSSAADPGSNVTPLGKVLAATAITDANVFGASDTISIEAATVTTFIEGEGVFFIVLKHAAAAV